MKHCHECDSDVADNDIFCPYCGISMQGVAVASASEDAFSSTIVIPTVQPASESLKMPEDGDLDVSSKSADSTPIESEETSGPQADHSETADEDNSSLVDDSDEPAAEDTVSITAISDLADETPRIAERLTGPVGSISGRFDPPSVAEVTELDEASEVGPHGSATTIDEVVEPNEHNLAAEARFEEESILDPEEQAFTDADNSEMLVPEVLSGDVETTVDDIPTPFLLSDQEIDNSLEATDVPELDETPVEASKPEDPDIDDIEEHEHPLSGEAVVPSLFPAQAEAESDSEPSSGAQLDSSQLSEQLPEVQADAQSVAPLPLDTEPPVDAEVEANKPKLVANTGEDLEDPVIKGGTSPNIASSDTDGRRSGLKPLAEGTVLNNRYDIVRKIGGGGMGAVYLANDRNLGGVQRAVKEMVQSHIEEEQQEKAVEDFKRESTILSTLDHPSIPTIYDYFFDAQESRFYLVMKYISGGDLAGMLRSTPEGRIDERTVVEWSLQIIDVLDYLHNLPTKIVYRDLKPSNVMIDGKTGRIMLIDFGIARSINQNQEKGVTAVGTMGYAPPELFSGNVEPRSDIYSLGSTMFHLLTGADPQNNPLLIFDFQKNPRPRQINPQLSDQIERILMRSVEYNADARFASAAEMKHALAAHLDNLRNGQITYGVTEVPQSVSLSHQIVFCGFCGQRIVATDMFCAFCGSKQPLAQHGVHREVYSHAVGTARLVIEGTSDLTVPAYALEKNENLVGRRDPMSNIFPEVDLSKYDPQTKISRRHAKIWRDGTNYLLEDLGSSNGTILLSKISDTLRLQPHRPHPLASGDRIRIGDTTLQFLVG